MCACEQVKKGFPKDCTIANDLTPSAKGNVFRMAFGLDIGISSPHTHRHGHRHRHGHEHTHTHTHTQTRTWTQAHTSTQTRTHTDTGTETEEQAQIGTDTGTGGMETGMHASHKRAEIRPHRDAFAYHGRN